MRSKKKVLCRTATVVVAGGLAFTAITGIGSIASADEYSGYDDSYSSYDSTNTDSYATDSYSDPNAYGSTDSYSDPNAYGSTDSYSDPNAYGSTDSYATDSYSDPNAYGSTDSYGTDSYSDPNAYGSTDSYGTDSYSDPNAYGSTDTYSDPNAYGSTDSYSTDSYSDPNAYGTGSDSYSDPNAYGSANSSDPYYSGNVSAWGDPSGNTGPTEAEYTSVRNWAAANSPVGLTVNFADRLSVNGMDAPYVGYAGPTSHNTGVVTLNHEIASDFYSPGSSSTIRSLIIHEIGHAASAYCSELANDPVFGGNPEAWATSYAVSRGYSGDGSGTNVYGRPTPEMVSVASGCR